MAITLHTEITEELPEQTELEIGRFRDEFQLQVDKDVEALKVATATAKWPAHDPAKLFHRYVVGADDKAALKGVIRRAATLHKVVPAFYKDGKTEAGHIVVKFHVDRKPVLKDGEPVKKDGKIVYVEDDTLNKDGTPKAAKAA
jgi:hypothetical protein